MPNNPFTLEFTLKQHTPIIHFQHDQEGATLRATEVKPKLDKFMMAKLKGFDNVKKEHPEWLIGKGEHPALNFQMKIICQPDKTEHIEQYPCFFANMGEDAQKKHLVFFNEVIVYITSFNDELKGKIKEFFPEFMAINNFATRQSKGFGGFTYDKTNQKDFEQILKQNYEGVFRLYLNNPINIKIDHRDLFKKIELEYKILKAGDSGRKIESKLRQYYNKKGIEWEKPAMQEWVSKENGRLNIKSMSNDRQYVRALLGLAETFEYPHNGKIKISVAHKPADKEIKIERMQSPIIVKVFKNIIYFCANQINSNIYDKEFNFKFQKDGIDLPYKLDLRTPKGEFQLSDFLAINLKGWTKL